MTNTSQPLGLRRRAWIAWIAGAAGVCFMILLIVAKEVIDIGHTTIPFEGAEWFWKFPIVISTLGIPGAFALGIMDWTLERSSATKAFHYAVSGSLAGAAAGFCLSVINSDDPSNAIFDIPLNAVWWAWRVGLMALSGLVGALTFWALARHARKSPPFWSDVF